MYTMWVQVEESGDERILADHRPHACRNLFSRPCESSGKLLALDPTTAALVLPYLRLFQGSREDLVAAAIEGGPAFHAHVDLGLMSSTS